MNAKEHRKARRAMDRERQQAHMQRVHDWLHTDYPALKLAAKLVGFDPDWGQYEKLSAREMYNKRKLVMAWIDYYANPRGPWRKGSYGRATWLDWKWQRVLSDQAGRTQDQSA